MPTCRPMPSCRTSWAARSTCRGMRRRASKASRGGWRPRRMPPRTWSTRRRCWTAAACGRSCVPSSACSRTRASRHSQAANCPACSAGGGHGTASHPSTATASRPCCCDWRAPWPTPATPTRTPGSARAAHCSSWTKRRPCSPNPMPSACARWLRAWATTSARCGCSSIRRPTGRGRTTATTTAGCGLRPRPSCRSSGPLPRRRAARRPNPSPTRPACATPSGTG